MAWMEILQSTELSSQSFSQKVKNKDTANSLFLLFLLYIARESLENYTANEKVLKW